MIAVATSFSTRLARCRASFLTPITSSRLKMPAPASASATTLSSIESGHSDMVHDCQLDWYGKRLATCSSDRTVKIFDVEEGSSGAGASAAGGAGSQTLLDTLRGHDGPVWAVAWGHPKFGSILASAGYDGKVFVWREVVPGQQQQQSYGQPQTQNARWERIKEHGLHGASVNAIAWAPHELGPILACASSDGKISVLTFNNDSTWDASLFAAHNIGVNSISWAPAVVPSSLISPSSNSQTPQGQQNNSQSTYVKKFATGGCDNLVKIWTFSEETKTWTVEETLEGHTDWVRDVAFAPGVGLPRTYLASAGQDRQVIIWTQDAPGQAWQSKVLDPLPYLSSGTGGANQQMQQGKFPDVVWRVSWSVTGNVLAVSAGDGKVSLWKENLKGAWECVSEVAA